MTLLPYFDRARHTPDPHARMPSYGLRCLRRGVPTDAPLTRCEAVGFRIGCALATTGRLAKAAGGLMVIGMAWLLDWDHRP